MRKINGQPVDAITDISEATGGQALKWDASTGRMAWELQDGTSYLPLAWYGARGVFSSGHQDGSTNVIDYVTIASAGNAIDFGDTNESTQNQLACSNGNRGRGVFAGGGSSSNVIMYVTIATTDNATDFGDLTVGRYGGGGASNGSRGIFMAGYNGSAWSGAANTRVIDYIAIDTTGNATDFGDMAAIDGNCKACNNATRAVAGGNQGGTGDQMEYITMDTTGNATDFGNLTGGNTEQPGGTDNTSDRGLFVGGSRASASNNTIDYITISSTGNATDFGDLTEARYGVGAVSDGSRGVFAGGQGNNTVIDYRLISSTGNAADFGDLTQGRHGTGAVAGD